MTTASLTQLSLGTSEDAVMLDISDDGRFVSYVVGNRGTADSGNTLVVKDLLTGAVQTVASFPDVVVPGGETLQSGIIGGDLSADGRFIVFGRSNGTLVNGAYPPEELFVKDLVTGTVTPIASGGAPHQGDTAQLSSDGRFVAYAFPSDATGTDIRLHDRVSGSDKLVVHLQDSNGFEPVLAVSTDGNLVLFQTLDPLLGETSSGVPDMDVFLKDMRTGSVVKLTDGGQASDDCMTPDGHAVVYSAVVPSGSGIGQVYLHDFSKPFAADQLVSASMDGTPGNGGSVVWSISADGNVVAFTSTSTNLVANDTDGLPDLFVKDLVTGEVTLVAPIQGRLLDEDLSPDGSRIVFSTNAGLILSDTDGAADVYLASFPKLDIVAVAGDNVINGIEASGTTVTGTSNAVGSTVSVIIDGHFDGTGTVAADGSWTVNIDAKGLPDGPHKVEAIVLDAFGNTASDGQVITVDSVAPLIDVDSIGGDFVVNVAEARAPVLVTGTSDAIGNTVAIIIDGHFDGTGTVAADGSWTVNIDAAGLPGGPHSVEAVVLDASGNAASDVEIAFVDKSHAFADLSATALDGINGFKIDGSNRLDMSGRSVASAGDLNGDGFDDVIIGTRQGGQSFVVFGKAGE